MKTAVILTPLGDPESQQDHPPSIECLKELVFELCE